jgi:hypothetical protein
MHWSVRLPLNENENDGIVTVGPGVHRVRMLNV